MRGLRLAVLVLAVAPVAAHAASVGLGGTSLRVTAAPGEANALTVTSAGGLFTVVDTGSLALTAGLGCTQAAANRVTCSTSGVSSIAIDASDGDDSVVLAGITQPATLTDGPGNDTITGGAGNDTFIGGLGDDTLSGGPGNDAFGDAGGVGADTLAGGTGTDTADYSSRTVALAVSLDDIAGDGAAGESDNVRTDIEGVSGGTAPDTLIGSPGNDTLRGNGGADTFDGRGGADSFVGGSDLDTVDYSARTAAVTVTLDGTANDGESGEGDNARTDVEIVVGGDGADRLTGQSGTNALRGGPGADVLNGGGGDDALDGGAGADSLTGGAGTDVADYSARSAPITADFSTPTRFGEDGEDDAVAADVEGVWGGSGDDTLIGGSGTNVLRGNAGDDVLDGRLGADDVSGGDGTDSVSFAARTAGVTVKLDNSANDGQSGEGDNIRNDVERITGGSGDDRLYADDDANTIAGGGGNDTVYGYGGNDTITTTSGADQVWGGTGDDTIAVADGANKAYGEDGNDTLTGGAGNETLDGGKGDDALTGAAGNDRFTGSDGNDTLDAGEGDDSGDAGAGDDRVLAGDGNDNLNGGDGNDTLEGGAGNDTVNGGDGGDVVSGGDGDDKAGGNDDADIVSGNAGNDQVWGGTGDDVVTDTEGDNRLYGEDGLDKVSSGDGNDLLSGGDGDDLLAGAGGDDELHGDEGNDRVQGGDGTDELDGDSGDDVLDGGLGPDDMEGDDGVDTVDYGSRTAGVVTNDGDADDGQANEGDNVATSIDDAIGGAGADRITFATDSPHHLDGGDGNDLLRGGAQGDALVGGRGKDFLFGEGGTDAYDGGPGPDHLSSADEVAEKLKCGTGKDVSVQDKIDTAIACEKRTVKKLESTGDSEPVTYPVTPDNAVPVAKPVKAPGGLIGVRRRSSRGRFVAVPGSPGTRVDRRILPDVLWLMKHYPIRIGDGFAMSGHAQHGEHPLGLALDIVPGPGGSWDDIDRLARWAEPRQNHPRAPFRWVGYNGDVNHGRGNHLHLSWMHAPSKPGTPAAWVVTMRFKRGAGKPTTGATRGAGALIRYAKASNAGLGGHPSYTSGVKAIRPCQGVGPLEPALKGAAHAFGLKWRILAALTETESGFGCNMGPSSAGAIGWTQFMPATWRSYGMDADGDGKADPYNSVDAVYSSARLLRASGAPGSYRRALYAYNHSWEYVRIVLERAKKY